MTLASKRAGQPPSQKARGIKRSKCLKSPDGGSSCRPGDTNPKINWLKSLKLLAGGSVCLLEARLREQPSRRGKKVQPGETYAPNAGPKSENVRWLKSLKSLARGNLCFRVCRAD